MHSRACKHLQPNTAPIYVSCDFVNYNLCAIFCYFLQIFSNGIRYRQPHNCEIKLDNIHRRWESKDETQQEISIQKTLENVSKEWNHQKRNQNIKSKIEWKAKSTPNFQKISVKLWLLCSMEDGGWNTISYPICNLTDGGNSFKIYYIGWLSIGI